MRPVALETEQWPFLDDSSFVWLLCPVQQRGISTQEHKILGRNQSLVRLAQ
jgi:hypothetical protein